MDWKFTDEVGNLCRAYYSDKADKYIITFLKEDGEWGLSLSTYLPEEVYDLINRGIWKRLS